MFNKKRKDDELLSKSHANNLMMRDSPLRNVGLNESY